MADRDYATRVRAMHTEIVNLSTRFEKETDIPVHAQLLPLIDALQRVSDDANAFLTLAEGTLATAKRDNDAHRREQAAPAARDPDAVSLKSLARRYKIAVKDLRSYNPHLDEYADSDALPRDTPVHLKPKARKDPKRQEVPPPPPPREEDLPPTPRGQPRASRSPRNATTRTFSESGTVDDYDYEDTPPDPPRPAAKQPRGRGSRPRPPAREAAPRGQASPAREPPADTIRSIASRHGVSVQALLLANEDRLDGFEFDQPLPPHIELTIPAGARAEEHIWTVRGDTIDVLAFDLAIAKGVLREYNPDLDDFDDDEHLPAEMELVVPLGESVAAQREHTPERGPPTRLVSLRVPTRLEDIADDHECTIDLLMDLNRDRRAVAQVRPGSKLPAGTVLAVPDG